MGSARARGTCSIVIWRHSKKKEEITVKKASVYTMPWANQSGLTSGNLHIIKQYDRQNIYQIKQELECDLLSNDRTSKRHRFQSSYRLAVWIWFDISSAYHFSSAVAVAAAAAAATNCIVKDNASTLTFFKHFLK